jgi:protein-S-isoprenylcysteine O-methyltransferase Ste14
VVVGQESYFDPLPLLRAILTRNLRRNFKDDDNMRKPLAAAGSAIFFVLAPGVVAGLIPWWLTGWRAREPLPYWAPLRVAGVALLAAGVVVLVHAFVRFVVEGAGTPAPVAPTQELVVGGLYRYVRNPMYLAVVAAIVGQALALGQPALLLYAGAVGAATGAFVHWYEQPDPGSSVRRAVRGLPACRASLVAAPTPVGTGRGRPARPPLIPLGLLSPGKIGSLAVLFSGAPACLMGVQLASWA